MKALTSDNNLAIFKQVPHILLCAKWPLAILQVEEKKKLSREEEVPVLVLGHIHGVFFTLQHDNESGDKRRNTTCCFGPVHLTYEADEYL